MKREEGWIIISVIIAMMIIIIAGVEKIYTERSFMLGPDGSSEPQFVWGPTCIMVEPQNSFDDISIDIINKFGVHTRQDFFWGGSEYFCEHQDGHFVMTVKGTPGTEIKFSVSKSLAVTGDNPEREKWRNNPPPQE